MSRNNDGAILSSMHQRVARIELQTSTVIHARVTAVTVLLEDRLHVLCIKLRRCRGRGPVLNRVRAAREQGNSGGGGDSHSYKYRTAQSDTLTHSGICEFLECKLRPYLLTSRTCA